MPTWEWNSWGFVIGMCLEKGHDLLRTLVQRYCFMEEVGSNEEKGKEPSKGRKWERAQEPNINRHGQVLVSSDFA